MKVYYSTWPRIRERSLTERRQEMLPNVGDVIYPQEESCYFISIIHNSQLSMCIIYKLRDTLDVFF